MAEISLEEFAGAGTPEPTSSSQVKGKASPSPAILSVDEFMGTDPLSAQNMQHENRLDLVKDVTGYDPRASVGSNVLKLAKQAGGEVGALADFILSVPGFMISTGAEIGGTIQAAARGVPLRADPNQLNPVTAYSVGRQAGETFGGPFMNPVKKVLDFVNSGQAYDESKTSKGMEKLTTLTEDAGKWVEEASGGKIGRDSVPMLVDTLMASGVGVGAKTVDQMRLQKTQERLRQQAVELRKQAEADAEAKEISPEAFAVRAPVQQQINDMLAIKTPAERARENRKRAEDAKAAFTGSGRERNLSADEQNALDVAEAEGRRSYGTPEEQQHVANERLGQAEILDILQRAPQERTAEDITRLRLGEAAVQAQKERAKAKREGRAAELEGTGEGERVSMEEAMSIAQKEPEARTREENTKLQRWASQRGSVSQEALMLLGAAGIGAVAGSYLGEDKLRGALLGSAAATAPLTMLHGLGAGGVKSRFRQSGAVKAPGGMWHPEAVERLTNPLKERLTSGEELRNYALDNTDPATGKAPEHPADKWADKAIRNYLNKYAGTERDPLKDVEIPGDSGTIPWRNVWDAAVSKHKVGTETTMYGGLSEIKDAPPGSDFYMIGNSERGIANASQKIENYLSHVGDYLRQNVKPEDLPRYDLVRAVRETAENDKRVAKQMEKAQEASTKDLPVYKEYKDGFRWVELKLPEKLTPEQQKQVRPLTAVEKEHEYTVQDEAFGEMPPSTAYSDLEMYMAVGPDGKPVKNAYTGETAIGKTPEEAWLAGRLAEEGNTMGHCVGGYCPSVASGESRIFSLRDPKGKSHVTVEVSPPDVRANHTSPEHFVRVMGGEWLQRWNEAHKRDGNFDGSVAINREIIKSPEYRAWLKEQPSDIVQIKGKQNRAPNKEYLPYVQDFVRDGKWGEVGDLGNTGLNNRMPRPDHPTLGPLARKLKELYGDQRFYTDEEWQNAVKLSGSEKFVSGRRVDNGEAGRIDAQIALGLSALGLGGIVGSVWADDPLQGAILGSLAGFALSLPGSRARFKDAVEKADYFAGVLSTRIGNISPEVLLRAREYEMRQLTESHALLHRVAPWMKQVAKLPKEDQQKLATAAMNGDRDGLLRVMQGKPELVSAWRDVKGVLNELGERLQGRGRFKSMLDDYFPRLVKDVEGLKQQLERPVRERLEARLHEAEKEATRKRGVGLTDIERSAIINREIQGWYRAQANRPDFTRGRRIKEINEKILPFYYTPSEALFAYVRGATQDLEMARFFGKDLAEVERGGQRFVNVDVSIGNLVGRELAEKRITQAQAQEMIGLLESRFQKGDLSPDRIYQSVRNLANMGLLGNIVSAATQIGDVAMPIYAQGLRSTLTALGKELTGRSKFSAGDFGLADHVAEEFVGQTKTASALNKMLKASGFSAIDRFGKSTMLNAAHDKLTRWAQQGSPAMDRKYKIPFGEDYPALIQDLKDGKITNRVRLALFSELSDFQPISKLEVPQAYLDHPNGRLMYMLKTFMIKQMDIIRRDSYNEIKKGNVSKGLANLTGYAMLLGISGATTDAIKNWLMGRPITFNTTDVLENVLKTFGWSTYTIEKAKKNPIAATANAFLPPYQMMDQILTADPKAIQYIPIIGKLYYNWELGGREEAELREAHKAKKAGQEYPLSNRAEDYKDRKKEKAREKRERYPGPSGVRG